MARRRWGDARLSIPLGQPGNRGLILRAPVRARSTPVSSTYRLQVRLRTPPDTSLVVIDAAGRYRLTISPDRCVSNLHRVVKLVRIALNIVSRRLCGSSRNFSTRPRGQPALSFARVFDDPRRLRLAYIQFNFEPKHRRRARSAPVQQFHRCLEVSVGAWDYVCDGSSDATTATRRWVDRGVPMTPP